jgi:hypothetical protein
MSMGARSVSDFARQALLSRVEAAMLRSKATWRRSCAA